MMGQSVGKFVMAVDTGGGVRKRRGTGGVGGEGGWRGEE